MKTERQQKLGTGNQTIEAVADEGYVFTGWEISGVELSDATANPLTFTMPTEASTIIKAKFAKTVSVTLKANDVEYGTVTSGSKLTGLGNGDTVELTATPKRGQQCKVQQVGRIQRRRRNCAGNKGTDYRLTEAVSGSGKSNSDGAGHYRKSTGTGSVPGQDRWTEEPVSGVCSDTRPVGPELDHSGEWWFQRSGHDEDHRLEQRSQGNTAGHDHIYDRSWRD